MQSMVSAQVSSLSSDCGAKLRFPSQNSPSVAPKLDSNITKPKPVHTEIYLATRGLFWDGSRNSNQRSDDENDTPEQASKLPHHTNGMMLAPTHDLGTSGPIHSGSSVESGFRAWSPPSPKPSPCH
ncbi:hypothetical protein AVEN_113264-1 [Araneus ventricosus]|uniref:Uncharacterized protein n=1 Tax=Araneus ventricosus TaxID=182803 RepID=A0A4Y2K310_ARAVE|nr:hypothetical protein AVEN_113264-1 [Araneus ventricosus]